MIVLSVAPALCVAFTAPLRIVLVRKCLESLEISERSKHKQNISKTWANQITRDTMRTVPWCQGTGGRVWASLKGITLLPWFLPASFSLLNEGEDLKVKSREEWPDLTIGSSIGLICVPSLHESYKSWTCPIAFGRKKMLHSRAKRDTPRCCIYQCQV